MKTELNINKLIEETQTLCHDGKGFVFLQLIY
jgi:hypothetical protein